MRQSPVLSQLRTLLMGSFFLVAAVATADKSNPSDLPLVDIPPGPFQMGERGFAVANRNPEHTVLLQRGFQMSKNEITNRQFCEMLNRAYALGLIDKAALAAEGRKQSVTCVSKSPQKLLDIHDEDCQIDFQNGLFTVVKGKEDFPVIEVSWWGAAFFCNMQSMKEGMDILYNVDEKDWPCTVYGKNGYRLPTEAEWEYAARYRDGRRYPWGNEEPTKERANVNNSEGATVKVGSYPHDGDSALGVSDLCGNVAEWCNDWYDLYSGMSMEVDPTGPPQSPLVWIPPLKTLWPLRVVRGGAWQYDPKHKEKEIPFRIETVIHEDSITSMARSFDYPGLTRPMLGFRPVRIMGKGMAEKNPVPLLLKSVTMTAGPDKKWFNEDDTVHHYYTYEYRMDHKKNRMKWVNVGPDKVPFTADDTLFLYEKYILTLTGDHVATYVANGPGPDNQWFNKNDKIRWEEQITYNEKGQRTAAARFVDGKQIRLMTFRHNAKGQEIADAEFDGPGEDGEWGTPDDKLEKHHRFTYNKNGQKIQSREYHAHHSNAGPDGKWFTDDDPVFATKLHQYDEDGKLVKELKAIGAGPDKEWFTDDDVLQYYSILVYTMADK